MAEPAAAPDPRTLADLAWGYIESRRVPGSHRWWLDETDERPPNPTLYHGGAGVALYALERGETEVALRGALTAGRDALDSLTIVGQMGGLGGVADVVLAVSEATADAEAASLAGRLVDRILERAEPRGAGIGWVEPMPFANLTGVDTPAEVVDYTIGAAGVLVVLLRAHRAGHGDALGAAKAVAARLVEIGERHPQGLAWYMAHPMPWPFAAPSISHGGAGIALALTQLYRATGEAEVLELACAGAEYTLAHTVAHGDGCLVVHRIDVEPPIHYLGLCHGPAGTGRLLDELHELTGEQRWADSLIALWDGLEALGAPEHRSEGLWNNHSQCCGDAGIGDFALYAWQRHGEQRWLEMARRCASVITAAATITDGTASWAQAEHRSHPGFVQRQTGYLQGAAGIGAFCHRLAEAEAGNRLSWNTSDWPAPARAAR